MLYFITSAAPDYPIKIGYTAGDDAQDRCANLQTGNPEKLFVLATCAGDYFHERRWHRDFADDRLEGELFRRTHRLLSSVERTAGYTEDKPIGFTGLEAARPTPTLVPTRRAYPKEREDRWRRERDTDATDDEFMTVGEVCAHLKMTRGAVGCLGLKAWMAEGLTVYRREDVDLLFGGADERVAA